MVSFRKRYGAGLLIALFALACSTQAEPQAAPAPAGDSAALAVVDGKEIREDELGVRGQLLQLEQQAYQVRMEALEEAIADRLLAAEAERRGVAMEALVESEISSKVSNPSDLEVEAFYEQNKARIRAPLQDVRTQVMQLMRELKERDVRGTFVDSLRAKSDVKVLLDSPRLPIDLSSAPMRGPETAPVTIVEFSDFQCPFCRRIQPTLAELQQKYGDKIRWSFKDLPLVSIHPEAQKAAEAARCAGEQGKFWEYRSEMFEVSNITMGLHTDTAKKLELDGEKFQSCLESDRHSEAVQADSREAEELGISGTPAFVINGVLLSGAQPVEAFTAIIDRELARTESR